jgi:hypothetical protein
MYIYITTDTCIAHIPGSSSTILSQTMAAIRAVSGCTAILIIIEGQFQLFQRLSSSKLVLRTVDNRFEALNHYENGSIGRTPALAPP